jgi:error-prone DNA polymerase
MSEYVELHLHSAYSFHDGVSHPHELAAAAAELGYAACALTDHDAVHGSMEFAHAVAPLGVKAIHGAELTLAGGHHVTLIVEHASGWATLCRLLTLAHAETRSADLRRTPQPPRVALDDLLAIAADGSGLICLTGCAGRGVLAASIARGESAAAEGIARRLLAAFGRDHLRVELQRPFQRHDRALNHALERLAERLGVPTVATGNVHAHARERAALQDVFVAVRHNASLDETEPLRRGNSSHVMAAPSEMLRRFAEHPAAIHETTEITARVDFDLTSDLGYRYPGAQDPRQIKRLRSVCERRLKQRYGPGADHAAGSVGRRRVGIGEARRRLHEELAVIEQLGLSGFFLIHHDLLELAREVAREVRGSSAARGLLPPGRGRGSSVSSIVCYLSGLSHIDPLEAELSLGRFLHEEITALPDIDLDFPRDIRARLIPRIHERYGRGHSALVAAFPTYRTRGSLRALGKALALPTAEIERIVRTTDRSHGESLEERVRVAIAASPSGAQLLDSSRWRSLLTLLGQIHRLPRGISQHSGGMVISSDPLTALCPVIPAAMVERQIVQWDKDSCADAGFAKIDLLGLGMLSAVERAVETIHATRGEHIDLSRIDLEDPEVFRQIRAAETTGVFQIESRAQMQMLVRSRPENLNDLFIQVAIVRPGPISGGAGHLYLERRRLLREDPDYEAPMPHPLLEEALGETLGAIVFQDQVIEAARALAGFTAAEGEGLRRAMSRRRSREALAAYHRRFIAGAAANGVDEETAENVFGQIVGFSGFGFPKAHAAAFGLLAYQTAWLRAHYPVEFLCGLMNEQPMGFYLPDALVHDAQRRGIAVLGVDVNHSEVECTVEHVAVERVADEPALRIGLGYVKGVDRAALASLVAARAESGPFSSAEDLAARSGADASTLERLAWAGACDRLGGRSAPQGRREALWLLGAAPSGQTAADGSAQLALPIAPMRPPKTRPLDAWDEMIADYTATGLTASRHPLELLRERLMVEGVLTSTALAQLPDGRRAVTAGLVVARQRPGTAKGVVFVLLEDELGVVNVILSPPVYKRYRAVVRSEPLLRVSGRVERRTGALNIVAADVAPLFAEDTEEVTVADFTGTRKVLDEAAEIRAVAPVGVNFGRRGR